MKKLDHKWTGPYRILKKIGELAYRLVLQQDQKWIEDATQSERQAQVEMQAQAQRMKGSDLNSSNNSEGYSLQSMDI